MIRNALKKSEGGLITLLKYMDNSGQVPKNSERSLGTHYKAATLRDSLRICKEALA